MGPTTCVPHGDESSLLPPLNWLYLTRSSFPALSTLIIFPSEPIKHRSMSVNPVKPRPAKHVRSLSAPTVQVRHVMQPLQVARDGEAGAHRVPGIAWRTGLSELPWPRSEELTARHLRRAGGGE